jgi:iron complex transport system ATP-binding protein
MQLQVQNLSVNYGAKRVLQSLSFAVESPCFVAILGHNGCGKTTFFKALTAMLPYQGSLTINGLELKQIKNRAQVMSVLEQKNNVVFSVKVLDLVLAGAFSKKDLWSSYEHVDEAKAKNLLQQLNISHLANQDFTQLSGGEQQMVWLAQMMMQDTPLCLLDEPTQHLDLYNRKRIFELMATWVAEGKMVVCITHDTQYLPLMNGYLLNLSESTPTLRPLNAQNVENSIIILEQKL